MRYRRGREVIPSKNWSSNIISIKHAVIIDIHNNPDEYTIKSDCGKQLNVYPHEIKARNVCEECPEFKNNPNDMKKLCCGKCLDKNNKFYEGI